MKVIFKGFEIFTPHLGAPKIGDPGQVAPAPPLGGPAPLSRGVPKGPSFGM